MTTFYIVPHPSEKLLGAIRRKDVEPSRVTLGDDPAVKLTHEELVLMLRQLNYEIVEVRETQTEGWLRLAVDSSDTPPATPVAIVEHIAEWTQDPDPYLQYFVAEPGAFFLEAVTSAGYRSRKCTVEFKSGIRLGGDALAQVLQDLNWQVAEAWKTKTEDLIRVSLGEIPEPEPEPEPISEPEESVSNSALVARVETWEAKADAEPFRSLAEEVLLPALGMDIALIAPSKPKVSPTETDHVQILFHASPSLGKKQRDQRTPTEIWGYTVKNRKKAFPATDEGTLVADEDSGWVVAQVVGRQVYVLHNLARASNSDSQRIFNELLLRVRDLIEPVVVEEPEPVEPEPDPEEVSDEAVSAEADSVPPTLVLPEIQPLPPPVIVRRWEAEYGVQFKPFLIKVASEILYPVVQMPIQIEHVAFGCREPREEDEFFIWIWASPKFSNGGPRRSPISPIWGNRVSTNHKAFYPSGLGHVFFDEETGWAVAELVGNNLYIHHYLGYTSGSTSPLFRQILEEVVKELQRTDDERAAETKRLQELWSKNYVEACMGRRHALMEQTRREITEKQQELRTDQAALVKAFRDRDEKKRILLRLEAVADDQDKYREMFRQMWELPEVDRIDVKGSQVLIYTHPIVVEDAESGAAHGLGAFVITLYEDGSNGGVKWTSDQAAIEHSAQEWIAPCVLADGSPLLGMVDEQIPLLVAQREFLELAQLAIMLLRVSSPMPGQGAPVTLWPKAEVETTTEEETAEAGS